MNKKLLAAAVAAAVVAAPAAFADAVVYGKFHTSIDQIDNNTNVDNWQVNGRASRLGFKGSEDLGNGLKAIYQIEVNVNSDGGGTGQSGGSSGLNSQRNTFVGLSGGWGTFLVGKHDTPAKMAFYASGNELLGDSAIDLNLSNSLTPVKNDTAPIGVFSEYRANNAIAYVSPNFSGFSVAAAVIPGENNTALGEGDGIADHYSLAAMYKGGGLKASLAYQETEAFDETQETLQGGASYSFGMFQVGAFYEDTANFAFVTNQDYEAWAITGKVNFGNNAVSLVYTDSELDNDYESQGWGLAADHSFSKRTKVYAAYAMDERDLAGGGSEDVDVFSIGLIHDF
jgi:predicted porin